MTKGIGTLSFMSPEMLNKEDYDFKTDIYSFGVVLYFIGNLPKYSLKDKMSGKPIQLPKILKKTIFNKISINIPRRILLFRSSLIKLNF